MTSKPRELRLHASRRNANTDETYTNAHHFQKCRMGTIDVIVADDWNGGGTGFGVDLVRFVYNLVGRIFGRCFEYCAGPAFVTF